MFLFADTLTLRSKLLERVTRGTDTDEAKRNAEQEQKYTGFPTKGNGWQKGADSVSSRSLICARVWWSFSDAQRE